MTVVWSVAIAGPCVGGVWTEETQTATGLVTDMCGGSGPGFVIHHSSRAVLLQEASTVDKINSTVTTNSGF